MPLLHGNVISTKISDASSFMNLWLVVQRLGIVLLSFGFIKVITLCG